MALGIVPSPDALPPVRAAAEWLSDRLRPFSSSQVVKTFADRPAAPESIYGTALPRLREIAAAWDPEGVIAVAHPLA